MGAKVWTVLVTLAAVGAVGGVGREESECGLEAYFLVDPSESGSEFHSVATNFDFESTFSLPNTTRFKVVAGPYATEHFYQFKTQEECMDLMRSVEDKYQGGKGQLNLALQTTLQLLSKPTPSQQRTLRFVFIVSEGETTDIDYRTAVEMEQLSDVFVFVVSKTLERSSSVRLTNGNYDRILLDLGWRAQMKIAKQRWLLCPPPEDEFHDILFPSLLSARRKRQAALPALPAPFSPDHCSFNANASCSGDKESGHRCSCHAGIQWYYNPEKQECLAFYFHGCGGTRNRWNSREDCMATCLPKRTCWESPALAEEMEETDTICFRSKPGGDQFEPYCCNKRLTEWYNAAYRNSCPDRSMAYKTIPRNKAGMFQEGFVPAPFIGDDCSDLPCPTGFRCQQINPLFSKCCQLDKETMAQEAGALLAAEARIAAIKAQKIGQRSSLGVVEAAPETRKRAPVERWTPATPLPCQPERPKPDPLPSCWREFKDCEGCLRQIETCPSPAVCPVDLAFVMDTQDQDSVELLKEYAPIILDSLIVDYSYTRVALFDYGHHSSVQMKFGLAEYPTDKWALLDRIKLVEKPKFQVACNTLQTFERVEAELKKTRDVRKVVVFFPSQCHFQNPDRLKSVLESMGERGLEVLAIYAGSLGWKFDSGLVNSLPVRAFVQEPCLAHSLVSEIPNLFCPAT